MAKEPLTIHLDPDSELARALADADDEPVLLDSNGVRFRVIRGVVAAKDTVAAACPHPQPLSLCAGRGVC